MWLALGVSAGIVVLIALIASNRRPVKRSSADVASVLRALLDGRLDHKEWDFFVCVAIRDPRLESIRNRCAELWVEGSPYLESGEIDPTKLSELGRREVEKLLRECERVA